MNFFDLGRDMSWWAGGDKGGRRRSLFLPLPRTLGRRVASEDADADGDERAGRATWVTWVECVSLRGWA